MAVCAQVQGADRHHLARRAHRCQRRGARLGRHRAARHHQQHVREQGDREGRRRPDRGGGRRRRACRREEPVRADRRRSASGSTARSRCRGAIATGGAVLAAQAMGADLAYIGSAFIATEEARAVEAYKQMIVESTQRRHRLQPPLHRRARQLPEGLDPQRRAGPGQPARERPEQDELRRRRRKKAWKDIWGCGQGIGAVKAVVPARELVARLRASTRPRVRSFAPERSSLAA